MNLLWCSSQSHGAVRCLVFLRMGSVCEYWKSVQPRVKNALASHMCRVTANCTLEITSAPAAHEVTRSSRSAPTTHQLHGSTSSCTRSSQCGDDRKLPFGNLSLSHIRSSRGAPATHELHGDTRSCTRVLTMCR